MSTLTYADREFAAGARVAAKPNTVSIWRRMYNAIIRTQRARAEREVARYLASHGGVMTDEVEREMMLRFSGRA